MNPDESHMRIAVVAEIIILMAIRGLCSSVRLVLQI
jgi:hypothetical protein